MADSRQPIADSRQPQPLAVGPWHQGEFQIVRCEIDPQEAWPTFATLEEAAEAIERQAVAPELLLLAQPRPGMMRQAVLDRLQATAPLVRVVTVAGSWCEGELRTGRPLPGTVRLYWYELAAWWKRNAAAWATGDCTAWSLPLEEEPWRPLGATATNDQHATYGNAANGTYSGLVEIDTPSHETFSTLAAALKTHGWSAVWQPRGRRRAAVEAPAAGIWDGGQFDSPEPEQLAQFCQCDSNSTPNRPVVVLLDFPRAEHIQMARKVGATAVLGKPYFVDDLLEKLGG